MIDHDVDPIVLAQVTAARAQAEEEFEAGLLGDIKISERMFRQTKKTHERDFPNVPFDEEFIREEMLIQERISQIMLGLPVTGASTPVAAPQPVQTPATIVQQPTGPKPPIPYGWGSVVAMWIAAGIGSMAFFPIGIVLGVVALAMGAKLKSG